MNDLTIANRILTLPALERYQIIHARIVQNKLSELRRSLAEYIRQPVKATIVFPPSLDWSEQLFQRPQQMASALAKLGCRVLYFQHPEHWLSQPFVEVQPGLILCSAPPEVFWELPSRGLFTYAMTWNCRRALAPNVRLMIYDFVDDLSVFPGNQKRLMSDHQAFTHRAQLVLATSDRLLKLVQVMRQDVLLCPNGVDVDHFSQARGPRSAPPEDLQALVSQGKPIAGYVGALARWLDYDLIAAVATKRTDWEFVLVGPDHDGTLPAGLLTLPNVHWLGARPYSALPDYLRTFDAALVPFQLNQITHAASPVKLYEYMAAGKPVISTPIHEATRMAGVLLVQDAEEFSACLSRAFLLNQDPAYLDLSRRIAGENTWMMRAQSVLDRLSLRQTG